MSKIHLAFDCAGGPTKKTLRIEKERMSKIHLAYSISGETRKTLKDMSKVHLSLVGEGGLGRITTGQVDWSQVNILVSFWYLKNYEKWPSNLVPNSNILDSGAFSAWKSGVVIDIEALIAETLTGRWDESICLDVIGDGEASLHNALYMKKQGSPAYPVFHIGEDWKILKTYCKEFSKVGLSCRFGEPVKESYKFVSQCFAKAWPKKFHSFGWVEEKLLMQFPFHSADTASWNNQPAAWGRWRAFPGLPGPRGVRSLAPEIEFYLKLQERLKARWKNELAKLPD